MATRSLTVDSTQWRVDTNYVRADANQYIFAYRTKESERTLPEYYSRKIFNELVALPADEKSREVAVKVLDDVVKLNERLRDNDSRFDAMLKTVDYLLKQIAVYIESRQILAIAAQVQKEIQRKKDAEIKQLLYEKIESDEIMELMAVI